MHDFKALNVRNALENIKWNTGSTTSELGIQKFVENLTVRPVF